VYTLFIYQPETGTTIPLSGDAYVINADSLTEGQLKDAADGRLSVDDLPFANAWMANEKISKWYFARYRRFMQRENS